MKHVFFKKVMRGRSRKKLNVAVVIILLISLCLLYISPNLWSKGNALLSATITKALFLYSDFKDNKPIKRAEKLGEAYKESFGISPSVTPDI